MPNHGLSAHQTLDAVSSHACSASKPMPVPVALQSRAALKRACCCVLTAGQCLLQLDVEPGSHGWKCKCRDTFKGIYCSFTSSDYDPEKDLLLPDDASDTSMDSDDPLAAEETPCAGDNPCRHDGECFLSSHKSGYKCSV